MKPAILHEDAQDALDIELEERGEERRRVLGG
jgi:hypothetical protein